MKKLFAVVIAVLTALGLASAQAWNHDPASPIAPIHWGTVTPSYATCGDSVTGVVGMNQSLIDLIPNNAPAASFSAPLFKYKPTPLRSKTPATLSKCPTIPPATFTSDRSPPTSTS